MNLFSEKYNLVELGIFVGILVIAYFILKRMYNDDSTKRILILIAIGFVFHVFYVRAFSSKKFQYSKITFSTVDDSDNVVEERTLNQTGEVILRKKLGRKWDQIGLQNDDGYLAFDIEGKINDLGGDGRFVDFSAVNPQGTWYVSMAIQEDIISFSQISLEDDTEEYMIRIRVHLD